MKCSVLLFTLLAIFSTNLSANLLFKCTANGLGYQDIEKTGPYVNELNEITWEFDPTLIPSTPGKYRDGKIVLCKMDSIDSPELKIDDNIKFNISGIRCGSEEEPYFMSGFDTNNAGFGTIHGNYSTLLKEGYIKVYLFPSGDKEGLAFLPSKL